MKFYILLLCAFFMLTLTASNAPKIYSESEEEKVTVNPTGSWSRIVSPGLANDNSTPPGMIAAMVSENDMLFNWKPSPDTASLSGNADIADALLTIDESMLIIAERIGGANKNNSTRLVMINLYNNKICGGFELPFRRITRLIPVPGSNSRILAVQADQEEGETGHKLLLIDLPDKQVVAASRPLPLPVTSVVTNGRMVWFSREDNSFIGELPLRNIAVAPRFHESAGKLTGIVLTGNGRKIAAYGKGFCEFFSINSKGLFIESNVAIPGGFQPVWALAIRKNQSGLVLVDRNGKGYFADGSSVRSFNEKLEPYGCALPDGSLLLGIVRGRQLGTVALPELEFSKFYTPDAIRPVNRNRCFKLFSRTAKPAELIQLDVRCNIFKIILTGRRGKKSTVLLIDKTGVK